MLNQLLGGRYRVVQALGEGGSAQTYIVEDHHRPNHPKCAVKFLKPESNAPDFLFNAKHLFHQEARILEKLGQHDQIPRSLAYFEENQEFYLVQELIEGHTLSKELPLFHCWSESQVVQMLQDVLPILEFVHSCGVIHRDIKPSNLIRRQKDGRLVLIDFGAVKQVIAPQITAHGSLNPKTISIGTPGYMPAEQIRGKPRLNSDIYALGIIGIQALTGVDPFYLQEDEEGELIWRHMAEVSDELTAILTKMVRYHFQDRYQSATEVFQALQATAHAPIQPTSDTKQARTKILPEEEDKVSLIFSVSLSTLPQDLELRPASNFGFRNKSLWLMRVGIMSLLISIIASYTEITYKQSYLQAQGALESIEVLKAAEKYPDCLHEVETFSKSYPDLEAEVENLLRDCHQGQAKRELAEARKLAEQSKFQEAIAIAAQVPADTDVYLEAQQLMSQWASKIFLIASNTYQEGKFIKAIVLMGTIPASNPWAEKAQATIQVWNEDWQQNQNLMQTAHKAIDSGHWQEALNTAKKVSHNYYWHKQSELIIQKAAAKITAAKVAASRRDNKTRPKVVTRSSSNSRRDNKPRPEVVTRSSSNFLRSSLTEWICLNNPNPKCHR